MVPHEINQCQANEIIHEAIGFREKVTIRSKRWRKVPDLMIFCVVVVQVDFF